MINIIPFPQHCTIDNKSIDVNHIDALNESVPVRFHSILKMIFPNVLLGIGENGRFTWQKNLNLTNEAYQITISTSEVKVTSKDEQGLFYAIMSLKQMKNENHIIPVCQIEDTPRFNYRGLLIDASRHFVPKNEMMNIIDIMSSLKLNRLHWHLTDDHGWRIEIKKYPRLTEIGSKRMGSYTDRFSGVNDLPNSGYYNQSEIIEIIQFAKERFVEIIPEIDLPGHFSSAIAAYPELSCFPHDVNVAVNPGIYPEILCLGDAYSLIFIKNILDEVIALFPYKTIHLGGDEVLKTHWFQCEKCMETIKTNNLMTGQGLQNYFFNQLIDYLHTKGKEVMVWNESIIGGELSADAITQFWNPSGDMQKIDLALRKGYRIIDSNFKYQYFDYPFEITSLKKSYMYESIFASDAYQGQLIGIESALWTELISSRKNLYEMLLPRLFASAENAWTDMVCKDYDRFKANACILVSHYEKLGFPVKETKYWDPSKFQSIWGGIKHIRKMLNLKMIKTIKQMKAENEKVFLSNNE